MRNRIMSTAIAAATLLMASIITMGSPAAAAGDGMTPQGIGVRSWVDVTRQLYQCPTVRCNVGWAYPGPDQDLANACYYWDSQRYWDLVYNRRNTHSGFIQESHLGNGSPRATTSCHVIGVPASVGAKAILYQCPSGNCNQGEALPGHLLRALCKITNVSGTWVWLFNRTNGHEGFLPVTGSVLPAC